MKLALDMIRRMAPASVGSLGDRLLGFAMAIVVAHATGPSGFGLYAIALTMSGLAGAFTDLGLDPLLVRESADQMSSWQPIASLRLGIAVVVTLVAIGAAQLLGGPYRGAMTIACLAIPFNTLGRTTRSIAVGNNRGASTSMALLSGRILALLLGSITLGIGFGPVGMLASRTIGSALGGLASLLLVQPSVEAGGGGIVLWPKLIREAFPLAAVSTLGFAYLRIDVLLLGMLRGPAETGMYSAANRLLDLALVPATWFALSSVAELRHPDSRRALRQLLISGVAIGGAISVAGWALAPDIGWLFGPQIADGAGAAWRILVLAVPLAFVGALSADVVAARKQAEWLLVPYALAFIVNVDLNLVFLPSQGFIAAAWIAVLTEGLLALYLIGLVSGQIQRLWASVGNPPVSQTIALIAPVTAGLLLLGIGTYLNGRLDSGRGVASRGDTLLVLWVSLVATCTVLSSWLLASRATPE